jgi:hypothetical protein
LGNVKPDDFLFQRTEALKMETEVPAKHEIQDKEAVLVVLEGVAHIHNVRVVDLFKQSPLLDDIGDCLHLDTLCFVDILESIELPRLLMLDHTDLAKCTLADTSQENEVEKSDLSVKVNRRGPTAYTSHTERKIRRLRGRELHGAVEPE